MQPTIDVNQPTLARSDPARIALIVLAVIAIAAAVTWLGPILKPLLTAVFLFFVARSAERYLSRHGWPPWLAYLTLFVVTLLAATLVTPAPTPSRRVPPRPASPRRSRAISA